jgi:hypothetical protein
MSFFRVLTLSSATLLVLTGCSVFYPNWGATGIPEEPTVDPAPTETVTVTAEPEPTDSPEEVVNPETTAEQTKSSEPEIVQKNAEVTIIMAIPEADFGVLSVVAEVLGITEYEGACTLRFIGSDQEKTATTVASPSSDYTVCAFEYPLSDLPKGNAVVTVSYESERYIGRSAASSVLIP